MLSEDCINQCGIGKLKTKKLALVRLDFTLIKSSHNHQSDYSVCSVNSYQLYIFMYYTLSDYAFSFLNAINGYYGKWYTIIITTLLPWPLALDLFFFFCLVTSVQL